MHFTNHAPQVWFSWDICYIYIPCSGGILPLQLNYVFVGIDMFVYHITVSIFIFVCMLYNIIFGCNPSCIFFPISVLGVGYSYNILLLHSYLNSYMCEYYIYVYSYMLVYFIRSTPWLNSILEILLFVFLVYDLLYYFCYPRGLALTKSD